MNNNLYFKGITTVTSGLLGNIYWTLALTGVLCHGRVCEAGLKETTQRQICGTKSPKKPGPGGKEQAIYIPEAARHFPKTNKYKMADPTWCLGLKWDKQILISIDKKFNLLLLKHFKDEICYMMSLFTWSPPLEYILMRSGILSVSFIFFSTCHN